MLKIGSYQFVYQIDINILNSYEHIAFWNSIVGSATQNIKYIHMGHFIILYPFILIYIILMLLITD